eukprot:CAMPEP_0115860958 /NCGR_PEP_ID=MMETSP0287-20121206/17400_1 /TAXON_ID=412157 /ORGANISM="Chrysochromulina rotalis, Strain UIO044" /LENGTH=54 /DNA_ID=CAMNT_0003315307 /DNA_START=210 /DNA_END=371 /DNA_ORIENTATION=-
MTPIRVQMPLEWFAASPMSSPPSSCCNNTPGQSSDPSRCSSPEATASSTAAVLA